MGFALQWRKVRHLLTAEPTANASVIERIITRKLTCWTLATLHSEDAPGNFVGSDLGVMGEAVSQRQRVDLSLLVQQGPTVISCPMRFVDMTVEIL